MVLFIKSCVSELLGRKLNNNTGLKNKGAMKQPIVFPKRLLFWKEKKSKRTISGEEPGGGSGGSRLKTSESIIHSTNTY